jgi:hypothetical protein
VPEVRRHAQRHQTDPARDQQSEREADAGYRPSTFQKSCGNIQVIIGNSPNTTLSALCRMSNGSSIATSLSLNGIGNNNGNLVQQ